MDQGRCTSTDGPLQVSRGASTEPSRLTDIGAGAPIAIDGSGSVHEHRRRTVGESGRQHRTQHADRRRCRCTNPGVTTGLGVRPPTAHTPKSALSLCYFEHMVRRPLVLPRAPPSPSSIFRGFAPLPSPSPPQLFLAPSRSLDLSPTKAPRAPSSTTRPRRPKRRRVVQDLSVSHDHDPHEPPPSFFDCTGAGSSPGVISVNVAQVAQIHSMDLTDYESYVEAVDADAAGFCQLSVNLFAVQGWSSRTTSATVCISSLSCSQSDLTMFE